MKKKLIGTILCVLIATCTLTFVACGGTGNGGGNTPVIPNGIYARINEDGTASSAGEYILLGSYPQREVTDSTLKSTLDNMRGTLPTSDNSGNWTDYGYYISGEIESYMWYQDVEYNGEKYRGVYFTQYRPYYTTYRSSASNSYQDQFYLANAVYWFKFEPIKWRILSESNGEALILCEMIIDSQQFDYDGSYSNDYANSTIRAWLNDNFYNTAFNNLQKEIIKTTTVDNGVESTGYTSNQNACENTNDKIFLLSAEEVTTEEYGFSSDYMAYDIARQKQNTDYAKVQGCFTDEDVSYNGNGLWWLRSPNDYSSYSARFVNVVGDFNIYEVIRADMGIVPALRIQLS